MFKVKKSETLVTKVTDYRSTMLQSIAGKKRRKDLGERLGKLGETSKASTVFLINFDTRTKGEDAFKKLQHDVTAAIINGREGDHVFVSIFSPGGAAHEYANAAQQIQRLRDAKFHVIGFVDEVAASGGYMMACVCNELRANPFAMVGSIGVVGQIPIVEEALKRLGIHFKVYTQGDMKRTVTMFKEPTSEDEADLTRKMAEVHAAFANHVNRYRPQVASTQMNGEVWLGQQVVGTLVDQIGDHNTALVKAFKGGSPIFQITTEAKRPFSLKRALGFDTFFDTLASRLVDRVEQRLATISFPRFSAGG